MTLFFNPFMTFGAGYSGMITSENPVAYWRLGDPPGSTTVADSAVGTYPGTVFGTPTFGEVGITDGTALGNNGTAANYLQFPNVPSYSAGWCVEFWMYLNNTSGSHGLVTRAVSEATNSDWLFFVQAGIMYWRVINDANATTSTIQITAPPAGMWHHVVGTCNVGGTLSLFIDGKQVGTNLAITRTTAKGAGIVTIGKLAGTTTYSLNGRIDEVAIYNYVLSTDQIKERFLSLMADAYDRMVFAKAPRFYYRLDDTSGTTARDFSGNALHGTYNGTPALASRTVGGWTVADWDGTNDYVSSPNITTTGWAGVTAECWVVWDAVQTGTGYFSQVHTGSSDAITLEVGTVGSINTTNYMVGRYTGSAWTEANSGAALTTGVVHHLVGTITSAGAIVAYLDGVQVATASATFVADTEGWYIGRRHDTSTTGGAQPYFNGAIARAALYDRALTAVEVLEHYSAGTGL